MRTALLVTLLLASVASAELSAPREWLVIGGVDRRGRRPFNPDAIFKRYLLVRDAPPPREKETVKGSAREASWERAREDKNGRVRGRMVYAYAPLECEREILALARLHGGSVLFVNGDAFVGDVYGMRVSGVPVPLRKGRNHLFVRGVRGSFKLQLEEVEEGDRISERDATVPDLVVGQEVDTRAALVVLNVSGRARPGMVPCGLRKLSAPIFRAAPAEPGTLSIPLNVGHREARTFELKVRDPAGPRRRTFVSAIDGSVQEYSVLPPAEPGPHAGIVLTLHGAGVDAFNQARSYSPKKDLWIVAPTNRRPFGFDWQDWGRTDAYEVLEDALKWTGARRDRVYVTGHSMGGHGTWHLAANDPDRFLAIAPSAGWCGFDTYVGRPTSDLESIWQGADGSSLTMELIPNIASVPTFILHGLRDDNVPPSEAFLMEMLLISAGAGPVTHFQPDAGHWWDGKAAKGADCVDLPALFEHFDRHGPRAVPGEFEFLSVDPGVDAGRGSPGVSSRSKRTTFAASGPRPPSLWSGT
jgi:dienelactone hydrolase